MLRLWFALATIMSCQVTAASAEDIDVKAMMRDACKSDEIKTKFLDLVEKSRGEEEREIVKFEVERDCAHFELPDKPKNDTADPSPDATHTRNVMSAHFSPDGKTVLTSGGDGSIRIWSLETGKTVMRIDLPAIVLHPGDAPYPAQIRSSVFIGDGSKFAAAADKYPVRIYETATGKQLAEIPVKTKYDMAPQLAATSKGLLLISATENAIVAYDTTTNTVKYKISDLGVQPRAIAISEAANKLAAAPDKTFLFWKLDTGERLKGEGAAGPDSVDGLAFSRDGTRIAAGFGKTANIYDIAAKAALGAITVHPLYSASHFAFTADGNGFITCQSHPMMWDIASGKITRHFGPFTDACEAIDISPDGKFAVSSHFSSDVRVWDVETGAFERRLGSKVWPPPQ